MDGYPAGSLDHNVPYVIVSGFNLSPSELPLSKELQDQAILFRSEQPPLETREAKVLQTYLGEVDEEGRSWTGVSREEPFKLRIKNAGRSFLLPPRRARLPETTEPLDSPGALHSPFSPLSPVSSLYPDGLIDAQWIQKHQELVPSVILCLYTISSDPTTTTLQDNRLKSDIAVLRGVLAQSGYKTKLAVVLLSDDDSTPATLTAGLQERLDNIRRGSGLEAKSMFYIPPQESPTDLRNVADGILSALYALAVEYYRDLGRHAKKKRSRGVAPQPTVPPTTGTSKTLSLPDWIFRYDFKCAVLGEFRQEYDAAFRSFDQAYEVLLGQDVLDVIPSWSPRWNDARLLADVIAIRCIRLHFWMGQTSLAVRRWQAHRDRIADFVDRRGRGTQNYGWQAWEARWAMVMAEMINKCQLQGLGPSDAALFLPPEKAVLGDRLSPWELLHHRGYWYRIAARHLAARRRLAHSIPDEDRLPPDASPASRVASQAYNYDTYLCPEPCDEYPLNGQGVDHAQLIIDCLINARTEFQSRKQHRIAAELSLECAKEMASKEAWQDVLSVLRPLWEDSSFRSEGWADVSEDLCWLMRRAAVEEGRGELVVSIDWELMNSKFTRRPQWPYDLTKSLDNVESISRPSVTLTDDELSSFIVSSFNFRSKESRAGDTCKAQLSLHSQAFSGSPPVTLDSLRIEFQGAVKPIVLSHSSSPEEADNDLSLTDLPLNEDFTNSEDDLPSTLRGEADLTLKAGQTRVLEMTIPLREAGEGTASTLTLSYSTPSFDLQYVMRLGKTSQPRGWFIKGSAKPRQPRFDAHVLQVHPRPPKLEIKIPGPLSQYYTHESIEIPLQLVNTESETASIKLDTHLFGKTVPSFSIKGVQGEQSADGAEEEAKISGLNLGSLASSSTMDLVLKIDPAEAPTTYDLHLRATYHLESDPATPVKQILPVQLVVVSAFEANYDLAPRLHLEPWPSLFDSDNILGPDELELESAPARGLSQNWCLVCHYASFASEDLRIMGMEMKVLSGMNSARYSIVKQPEVPKGGFAVSPKTMHEARFDLVAQKISVDDRNPAALDLAFVIHWKREGAAEDAMANTTTMVAGHFLVLGSEPRVLASIFETPETQDTGLMHLDITVENPSSHFLTFGLSMDPSDDFAFSGAKQTTVHLLPMSRRTTTYRLLPLVTGKFVRPGITVRDKYFQKSLRIIPTEGMKIDKDGLLVWVPPVEGAADEEEEEEEEAPDGKEGDGDE